MSGPEPNPIVIGIDAGTSSTKAVAVDSSGQILAVSSSDEIETISDDAGSSEQNPEHIWAALTQACSRLPADVRGAVSAICLAAQSGSVIPTDSNNRPLGPAITWMDTRSKLVVEKWSDSERALIRSTTGWMPVPGLGLATISWWTQRRDQIDQAASFFRSVDGYLMERLCGRPVSNPSNSSGMQLMDIQNMTWSEPLCQLAGIKSTQLCEIAASGTQVGQLNPKAAQAMRLPPGLDIIVGGHDQACAGLALGASGSNTAVLSLGTAWVLTTSLPGDHSTMLANLPAELNLSPNVGSQERLLTQGWSLSQNIGGFGAVINWLREWWDESGDPAPENHPFFIPAVNDEGRASWGNFTNPTDHDRTTTDGPPVRTFTDEERAAAVLETCAFEVRRAVKAAQALNPELTELVLVGGGTRSSRLLNLIAATTKLSVIVKADAPWPAIGAAQIALDVLRDEDKPQARVLVKGPAEVARVEPSPVDLALDQHPGLTSDKRFEQYCQLVLERQ